MPTKMMKAKATTKSLSPPPLNSATVSDCSKKRTLRAHTTRFSVEENAGASKKHVKFSDISFRRFDVTCTGIVSCGPSIGLDWSYTDDHGPQSLDIYEQARVPCRKQQGEKGLWLTALQRKKLLIQKHGYSPNDLMAVYQNRIGASRRWAHPSNNNNAMVAPTPLKRRSSLPSTFSIMTTHQRRRGGGVR